MRRPRFHPLTVAGVERLTDEAVAVTFDVPRELWDEYAYLPGQHLTLRATIDGEDVRQSYSICQPRSGRGGPGRLRVASAVVEGGRMSTWLNTSVAAGDEIEVMTPIGSFTCPTQPTAPGTTSRSPRAPGSRRCCRSSRRRSRRSRRLA